MPLIFDVALMPCVIAAPSSRTHQHSSPGSSQRPSGEDQPNGSEIDARRLARP